MRSLATAARTRFLSPYALLEQRASNQPDDAAIFLDDRRISFVEHLDRVTRCAAWLLHHGFAPQATTGLCLSDELAHIDVAMAALCLGAPQVSLGTHENAATKKALARKVGVSQIIAERHEPWMEDFRVISVPNSDEEFRGGSGCLYGALQAWSLDRVAVFQNTSGSTSVPKTFEFTYERLLMLTERYASDPNECRSLRTGSIEFDSQRLARLGSLLAGNCSVFLRAVTLARLVEQCERAEVTGVSMNAYKLVSLLQGERQSRKLPSYTTVHSGGARVPGGLRKEVVRRLTDKLYVLYATSEVGMISRATPDQHEQFPEGVGFPASGVVVEIVGPNGDLLAPGEIGEIRIRKRALPSAYIEEYGGSSNFQAGWFYPHDLVSKGEGEPLIYHGRADDVLILNTINIFPSAIEDALEEHPDVKEAVAYPVKSRVHGEIPAAAVVLTEHASTNSASLLLFCRQKLGIRAPRKIVCVDRIPRNPVGKPLRRVLSES